MSAHGEDFLFVFEDAEGAFPHVWRGTLSHVLDLADEARQRGSLRDYLAGPDARVPVLRWSIAEEITTSHRRSSPYP